MISDYKILSIGKEYLFVLLIILIFSNTNLNKLQKSKTTDLKWI